MSGKSRNFRRRTTDSDEDEDDKTTPPPSSATTARTKPPPKSVSTTTTTTTTTAAAAANKPIQKGPKTLLSFAEDDGSEQPISFRPKSTSSSSRFNKPSSASGHKQRQKPSSSNVQPQAGTYTKEALLELQKNTRTLASSRPPQPPPPSSEPIIVLKGLLKPTISDSPKDVGDLEGEDISREKDDTRSRLASMGLEKEKDKDSYPDQATIDAIRAKRERMRKLRPAAQDFISLDSGSNHGEAEGLSDEEPEFQGRIGFFGEKVDNGKKGVFDDFDEKKVIDGGVRNEVEISPDEDEEDEEDKLWEEEQFRKGLGKRMDDSTNRVVSKTVPVVQSPQQRPVYPPAMASYASAPSVSVGPNIGGAVGIPDFGMVSIPQQAEIAKKALHENLKRMKESHGRTMASLSRTDENLSASLSNVTALEKSLSVAGEKFIFMQKLRDFVSVICEFLQHKAPFIEELEEQMQKLNEERAAAILERRTADIEDEMLEVEAAVNAAMSVFSKVSGNPAVVQMATNAAQAASNASNEKSFPVELDDFGRDVNLKKRMDLKRRADARQRRRARSDAKRLSSMENATPYQQIEGESSTDESDSEAAAYQSNRDLLLQTADQIFSDAAEEYSQLSAVIEQFEKWKKDYSSSYRDAYMSLSVPAIFSPYVRLELLKWDPLHEDSDFIDMNWHSLLYNYGIEDEDEDNISPDDADANIVPQLVEKVAIPILHHDVAHCWDLLSTRETKNVVSATDLVVRYVPASCEALIELVALLRNRLADAITSLVVPTWNPLVMKAVPNSARVAAYRFGTSVRLMRNICMWNKIIAMPILEKLVLDDLLSGKILPHLRSIQSNVHDAVTRSERVIASLSGVWAGPSFTGQRSPKLQPLVDYLLTLGRTLEKKHVSGVSEGEVTGLARRLKKMLVELNEYDQARAILRTFSLKEAL